VNEEIRELQKELEKAEAVSSALYEKAKSFEYDTEEWYQAWRDCDDSRQEVDLIAAKLDRALDKYWDENVEVDEDERWFEVVASSAFGYRAALYKLENDVLILKDPGEHDNLAGNGLVLEAEGLTPEDARIFIRQENESAESSRCQRYDGCHACTWKIDIVERFAVPRRFTKENEK